MLDKIKSKIRVGEIFEAHKSSLRIFLIGSNAFARLTAKYVKIAHILILLPKGGLAQKTGDKVNV